MFSELFSIFILFKWPLKGNSQGEWCNPNYYLLVQKSSILRTIKKVSKILIFGGVMTIYPTVRLLWGYVIIERSHITMRQYCIDSSIGVKSHRSYEGQSLVVKIYTILSGFWLVVGYFIYWVGSHIFYFNDNKMFEFDMYLMSINNFARYVQII